MKIKLITTMVASLMAASSIAPAYAEQGKSIFELGASEAKQTSKSFKGAPAEIKTNFGALRIYGPEQPWIDQSWRPGEIELVN